MTKEAWQNRQSYYEGLSPRKDGDFLEQVAALYHGLDTRFPNYGRFWQRIICPSSERPNKAIGFRKGTSKEIRRISQVSYSILQNLIQADSFAFKIQHYDFGFLDINIQECLVFSGNALQLLHELKKMIEERLAKILNQEKMTVFDNDKEQYWPEKNHLSRYRNYLTHSGLIMKYPDPGNPGNQLILKPDAMVSTGENPTVWEYMDEKPSVSQSDLIPLHTAVLGINEQTWRFINETYGKFLVVLNDYLESDEMQMAWGWESTK